MIHGIYLNGYKDDIRPCLKIRENVYQNDFHVTETSDEKDKNAVHILLFNKDQIPAGTVRITYDMNGDFGLDRLAVLPEYRNDGLADFIMHMAFDKAVVSGARRLVSDETDHNPDFFKKYDFKLVDGRLVLDLREYYKNHSCHD